MMFCWTMPRPRLSQVSEIGMEHRFCSRYPVIVIISEGAHNRMQQLINKEAFAKAMRML
jgi:hypothetical protein